MASLKPVKFFTTSWMIVRHKSKPQIQKTRIPHWIRLQTLETCKPVFDTTKYTPETHCEIAVRHKNPPMTTFERLLGEEMVKYLDNSPMVAVFQENSMKERAKQPLIKMMFYGQMKMKHYNRYIISQTLKGTKYEAIIPMFNCVNTGFLFGENVNVEALFTIEKKWPTFLLLAGIVDNRLLNKSELMQYRRLKNVDEARAQLCSTLNYVAQTTSQHLSYHQTQLGQSLDTLSKLSSDETKNEEEEKKS